MQDPPVAAAMPARQVRDHMWAASIRVGLPCAASNLPTRDAGRDCIRRVWAPGSDVKPDPFEMTVTQSIAQAEAVGDKARAEHAREALRRHRLARLEKARRAAENVDAADLRRWETQPGA